MCRNVGSTWKLCCGSSIMLPLLPSCGAVFPRQLPCARPDIGPTLPEHMSERHDILTGAITCVDVAQGNENALRRRAHGGGHVKVDTRVSWDAARIRYFEIPRQSEASTTDCSDARKCQVQVNACLYFSHHFRIQARTTASQTLLLCTCSSTTIRSTYTSEKLTSRRVECTLSNLLACPP